MGKNISLKQQFAQYIQTNNCVNLEQAFLAGARVMAQDTLDTLGDYACAVSGCKPEVLRPEEVYDRARDNLMVYYTQVLNK